MLRALIAGALALALAGAAGAQPAPSAPNMRLILAPQPAQRLSAYGLFADIAAQRPASGVVAYDLATPLFSDYALKRRYVFIPPGQHAQARGEAVFDFPIGTVLIKTFAFAADLRSGADQDARTVETRLLIRKREGWDALVYVWDTAARDATLQLAGAQTPVRFIDAAGVAREALYTVPNKNQCAGCHKIADALTPIGPSPRNLDRDGQLARWSATGLVQGALPASAPPTTLDARARAYLDVNCAHCHNPQGPASNSGLDLRYAQHDPALWGVRKRPVAAGRASAGLLFAIDPGHPDRSILLHRLQSTDPSVMMPELGRTLVHTEGVDLVSRWIAAMDVDGRIAE